MIEFQQPRPESEAEQLVLLESGEVNASYPVAQFFANPDTGSPSVPVIQVGEIQNKLLVAVPHSTWHRTLTRRIMPATSLIKPTLVEVGVTLLEDRETLVEGEACKLWIGFLRPEFMPQLHGDVEECEFDHFFHQLDDGELCLPSGRALVDVAQEHFAFSSAEETELVPDAGSESLESRMVKLEDAVSRIAVILERSEAEKNVRVGALKKPSQPHVSFAPSTKPASSSAGASSKKKSQPPFSHLDPGVVAAALQAGVDNESLQQMEQLIMTNVKAKRVKDLDQRAVPPGDPLSEDEEADGGPSGDSGLEEQGDPFARTLSKLAGIMELLTEDKRRKTSSSKLDQALDAASSGSQDGLSLGSGKKVSAARRALRTAFQEQPKEIYQTIERLLSEDLNSATLGPGMSPMDFNARAWVEFRSRIGSYKASAHSAWSAAGIIDSLANGRVDRARAQACLLLLQLDQSAADHGSWLLSAELSLEGLPPFTSLSQHQAPNQSLGEQPYSRLLEPQWGEIILGYLREQDDFVQRRRNVGRGSKTKDEEDAADPKKKPKSKAKAKARADEAE